MIDFDNAECDACHKKHVDVRTQVIDSDPARPDAIRKRIFFRCEDHIDCSAEEMQKLSRIKYSNP